MDVSTFPFDIKLSFIFYIVLVPEKSSNTLSDIVYSAVGAKSIIIATASNNPNSFLTTLKPFFYRCDQAGSFY